MSYQARFSFVGTPVLPKQKADAKRPFCKEGEYVDKQTKKKRKTLSLNFGVKESDSNMAFVEAFDSVQPTIKTMDTDNEKMDVDWDDRFDEDVVKKVANYRKYTVDLGEDHGGRQEFITVYDMIKHLQEYLPDYDGRVVVTGQFIRAWYDKKETYYSKFRVQNVFAAPDERKSRLLITADLFYNKDSVDDSEYDETKKMTLDCYIEQYINKDEGTKFFPICAVLSTAKFDMENKKHKGKFENIMKYLKVKSKNMIHIPWSIKLVRGAEEAEFDESMLTDAQREQYELGIATLDDFKPRGGIYGERIDELRLCKPELKNFGKNGDFSNGPILCDLVGDEFDELIYQPSQDETLEEAKKKSKSKRDIKNDDDSLTTNEDDDFDLF